MKYTEYRKKVPTNTPEKLIQQSIIEWMNYNGFKVFRINSGQTTVDEQDEEGNVVGKRMIKMAPTGTPDIIGCHKKTGRMVLVEVKRPGKVPTPVQNMVMQDWRDAGALVFVATSIEDVIAGVKNI